MPAAAVIPAPIAYIKVVVVKKLVVGCRRRREVVPTRDVLRVALLSLRCVGRVCAAGVRLARAPPRVHAAVSGYAGGSGGSGPFTLKKLECSKRALYFSLRKVGRRPNTRSME